MASLEAGREESSVHLRQRQSLWRWRLQLRLYEVAKGRRLGRSEPHFWIQGGITPEQHLQT